MSCDLNQLMQQLDGNPNVKHWSMKCVNSNGERKGYQIDLHANGKRYRVRGRSVVHVAQRALQSLHGKLESGRASGSRTKKQQPATPLKLVTSAESRGHIPLDQPIEINGVMHDMEDGPCMCGAWHTQGELATASGGEGAGK